MKLFLKWSRKDIPKVDIQSTQAVILFKNL